MAAKRSIDRKDVIATAQRELAAGKSREEILDELSERYFDRKTLAGYVGDVPDPELKEQYRTANTVLAGLLVVSAVFKVLSLWALASGRSPLLLLVLTLIVPAMSVWLVAAVWKMQGYIYRFLAVLALLGIVHSIRITSSATIEMAMEIALLAAIAGTSWYVGTKMFPHLRFGRPAASPR